jgi:hypothetical protein
MPVNTFGTIDNADLVKAKANYLNRGLYSPLRESADWKTYNGSSYVMGPNIMYQWKSAGKLY